MKKRLSALLLACLLCVPCAFADSPYDYTDPSIVYCWDELPWVTVSALNDLPMDNNTTTADQLLLNDTGTKLAMPEDPAEWPAWAEDVALNKTNGKGDLAFVKMEEEDFLRVCYALDDDFVELHKQHTYSDDTRIMISLFTGYARFNTGSDAVQHGVRVEYDEYNCEFTVSEFNALTVDETSDMEIMTACYFDYVRHAEGCKVTGNVKLRDTPASDAYVITKVKEGETIDAVYDYLYTADNGYVYRPVRYTKGKKTEYGWIADDYLDLGDPDSVNWIGCAEEELEYPSAAEILAGAEGNDGLTVTAVQFSKPDNGEAFTVGEEAIISILVTNHTLNDISRVEVVGVDDAVVSVGKLRTSEIAIWHEITADEAKAGSVVQVYSVLWTDENGEERVATSAPLIIKTAK